MIGSAPWGTQKPSTQGEPHEGWELPTEEDRFYALKRAIERETPEELEKKIEEEARALEEIRKGKAGVRRGATAGQKKKKKKKKGGQGWG